MKIKCLFTIILAAHSCSSIASEVVRSGGAPSASSGGSTYGRYLSCLNRLSYPVASGLDLNANDREVSVDQNPTLFYGKNGTQKGVFLVSPGGVTFDQVPLHKPKDATSEYPLSVKREDGKNRYFYLYTDEKEERGYHASYGEESFKENNPGTPFFELGSKNSQIGMREAIDGIVSEAVPRLDSMPKVKERTARYVKMEKATPWSADKARETLCSCMETGNATLVEKSKAMALALGLDEKEKCIEPLISRIWFEKLWSELGNEAHAAPIAVKTVLGQLTLQTAAIPRLVKVTDKIAEYCIESKAFSISFLTGRVSSSGKKCSPGPNVRLMTSDKMRGSVDGKRMEFRPIK